MLGLDMNYIVSLKKRRVRALFNNTKSFIGDGTDDYVDCGNADLIGTLDYSISVWFKTSTTGSVMYVINKGFTQMYKLFSYGDKIKFEHKAGGDSVTVVSTDDITDGNWHHCVVTADRDGDLTMYVDGSAESTTADLDTANLRSDIDDTARDLYIGSYSKFDGGSNEWNGNIDEVAIWTVVLSAADVTAIYNSGKPNNLLSASSYNVDRTSNLVGYWRCEDDFDDSSTNSNNGTAQDGATFSTSVP